MRGIAAIAATLVLAALPGAAGASVLADQPYGFDRNDRIVTDVMVDGKGPFRFLIDTASSRSLIFEHTRAQLGLTQSAPQLLTIYGINDVTTAVPVRPREMRIGGEAITGLTIGVLPDSPDEPDGVLGIDALARYFVVLDRAGMRFRLLTPDSGAKEYGGWPHLELMPHPLKNVPLDFWYFRARYNGVLLNTLFDLGASVTMLNWGAAEQLGLRKRDYRSHGAPEELRDVLGTDAPVIRITDLKISLADSFWNKPLAVVSGAPVFVWFNLDERPAAIVGTGLFKDNSLAIDFQGRRLYVGPPVRD